MHAKLTPSRHRLSRSRRLSTNFGSASFLWLGVILFCDKLAFSRVVRTSKAILHLLRSAQRVMPGFAESFSLYHAIICRLHTVQEGIVCVVQRDDLMCSLNEKPRPIGELSLQIERYASVMPLVKRIRGLTRGWCLTLAFDTSEVRTWEPFLRGLVTGNRHLRWRYLDEAPVTGRRMVQITSDSTAPVCTVDSIRRNSCTGPYARSMILPVREILRRKLPPDHGVESYQTSVAWAHTYGVAAQQRVLVQDFGRKFLHTRACIDFWLRLGELGAEFVELTEIARDSFFTLRVLPGLDLSSYCKLLFSN